MCTVAGVPAFWPAFLHTGLILLHNVVVYRYSYLPRSLLFPHPCLPRRRQPPAAGHVIVKVLKLFKMDTY